MTTRMGSEGLRGGARVFASSLGLLKHVPFQFFKGGTYFMGLLILAAIILGFLQEWEESLRNAS